MSEQKVSLQTQLAVIEEKVTQIHAALPQMAKTVSRHDRELLVAKVLFIVLIVLVSLKYPPVADALAHFMG